LLIPLEASVKQSINNHNNKKKETKKVKNKPKKKNKKIKREVVDTRENKTKCK
jgi:hypothetical protein